jgi:hypothetical protein
VGRIIWCWGEPPEWEIKRAKKHPNLIAKRCSIMGLIAGELALRGWAPEEK